MHGRVAAALAFPPATSGRSLKVWKAVMPTFEDFNQGMPVLWPRQLQDQLPATAKSLLRHQSQKMEEDVRVASEQYLPSIAADEGIKLEELQHTYRYAWLLVNTRCFYWDYPVPAKGHGAKRRRGPASQRKAWPRDDCMALCPVMDYFNHANDEGVSNAR